MDRTKPAAERLASFYGEMTSLDRMFGVLRREGVDVDHLQARDLYERDLDCQNLGASGMLDVLAAEAAQYATLEPQDTVLDVGCGMGGPGRFLVERFGCSVLGVDLLALRIKVAAALTERTGLGERITYRVADATRLPVDDGAFAQVWMLDVGIHVADKAALFAEVARVLEPGGLLVMHDQTGPLPKAMAPVTSEAPFIAPTLPQLIRYVEDHGLRLLTWRDTSARILSYWREVKAGMEQRAAAKSTDGTVSAWRARMIAMAAAYIETLGQLDGRTGILIAQRRPVR
jgi:cyclopropane fatty-acyl-phospholipid synthase-like methyltransferase